MKRKTIAVDFDGVIHAYSRGWHDGTCYDKPMAGAEEALKLLLRSHSVFILSTRSPLDIITWFAREMPGLQVGGIHPDAAFWDSATAIGITNRKLPAIAYIDDRGLRFTHWRDMLNYFT